MEQFISAVLSGLLVSFCGWTAKATFQYFKYYRNSKYSGVWIDEIYDENHCIVKRDIIVLKHNKITNCVVGSVKRKYPYEQTHRKWKCSGVITDNHLIVSFWSDDLIKSDGCVYASLVQDYTYEGYYLKEDSNKINKVKIRVIKDNKLTK